MTYFIELYLEIPRCNPENITTQEITSTSIWISWLYTQSVHVQNFSVSIIGDVDQTIKYTKFTEVIVGNLLPFHNYTYVVKAISPKECYQENLKIAVHTKQAGLYCSLFVLICSIVITNSISFLIIVGIAYTFICQFVIVINEQFNRASNN